MELLPNAQVILATNNQIAIDWAKSQDDIYQAEVINGTLNPRTN